MIAREKLWQLLALTADFYWVEAAGGQCRQLLYNRRAESSHPLRRCLPGYTLRQAGIRPVPGRDLRRYYEARNRKEPFSQRVFQLRAADTERFLCISGIPEFDRHGRFRGYHCCASDITEQHEDATRLQRFRAAIDTSTDMIYLVDPVTLRFIDVNQTACDASGLTRNQLLRRGPVEMIDIPADELRDRYARLIEEGRSSQMVREVTSPEGEPAFVEVHSRAAMISGRWVIIGSSRDVTRRRLMEERSERLQQMFSALSETNAAILRADSVDALFDNVCNAAIKGGRFHIAAIVAPDESGRLRSRARAGMTTDRLPRASISIQSDTSAGGGISGQAWRSGKPVISNDFQADPRLRHWADYAREYHLHSAAALPIRERGRLEALLLFYAGERNVFDPEIVRLLESMTENVSYALDSFASERERQRAEQQIRESEARFRSLTSLSSDFYWEQDRDLRFTKYEGHVVGEANHHAVRRMIGKRLEELPFLQPDQTGWEVLRATQRRHETFRDFEFNFVNANGVKYHFSFSGEPILDESGHFLGYRGISRDITEKKSIVEQIRFLATHDSLTGLPNRVMFMELLNQTIRSARRYPEHSFAVLFIDLDRFKSVNDTYGHHAGDLLLKDVAERLRQPLRESDVVARLGGDEFVVLLQHLKSPLQAEQTATKLLRIFDTPLQVSGHAYDISASIGISFYGRDAMDAETLMQHADSAMYIAKDEGRNNAQFYLEEINRRNRQRIRMERLLRGALARDELSVHYQARLSADGLSILGVEALLRWNSPELGSVPPASFIPIAEESGLILDIGAWVLQKACGQLAAWAQESGAPPALSVNLSARQFSDPELLTVVSRALQDSGYPAERLELEITESIVMRDTRRAIQVMHRIRDLGVHLALDDFGTGYSSLGQLKNYPLDTLKIDRTFVAELSESRRDRAIVQAIITMGHTLGLGVVAEGVETREQLIFLREQGCDQIQGYFCHRPSPAADTLAFCRHRHARRL